MQIWEWGHNRRAVTHRAEGQTKSFVLNIPPQGVLRVEFSGSSDSEHKGCCSISVLDKPLSLPFKPMDTNGIEWVEQEESPQDSQDSQGGDSEQDSTDSTPQETPPIDKNARIAEIKGNALVAEFLDLRVKIEAVAKTLTENAAGMDRVFNNWLAEWFLNPANMAKFDDVPYNAKDGSITARLGVAGWINKMQNLPEILSELKTKGMDTSKFIAFPDTDTLFSDTDLELRKFKRNIICAFWLANSNRDSFENERNRYVEIYAMPEARALIDELNTLEKS